MRRRAYPRPASGRLGLGHHQCRTVDKCQRAGHASPLGSILARLPPDPVAILTHDRRIGLTDQIENGCAAQGLRTQRRMREMNDA
jgi:hypothetical protein